MRESTLFLDDQLGLRIVNLALMKGLITPEEWSNALGEQAAESGPGRTPRPLCVILFDRGTLTRDQLHRLRVEADTKPATRRSAPRKAPLLEGSPVKFGKYRLFRELGRGARGTVYEATDSLDGRRVALKLLATSPAVSSDAVSRDERAFLTEAEAPLRLPPHPGLARVLEAGVAHGRRYLATEIVDGPDLELWMSDHADLRARVDLLRLAAEAVHHAHERGVAHLAISSRNILVDPKGRARVTDFAIGRMVRATPRAALDRRADVISLAGLLRRILEGSEPDLAARVEGCPTAADVANELLRWLDGTRARASRSRRVAWRAAAAATILAASLGVLALGRTSPAPASEVELLPEARGVRVLAAGSSPLRAKPEGLRIRPDAAGECRLTLDLDEAWSAGTELAELTIEYFDGGRGVLSARYDSTGGAYKAAGAAALRDTNAWIPWKAVLSNPRFFNRQDAGGDLQLVASGVEELRIRRLALRRLPVASLPTLRPRPAGVDPSPLRPGLAVEPDRRTGYLRVHARGRYLLEAAGDDVRLWIGGAPVPALAAADLEPGVYALTIEGPVSAVFSCLEEREGRRIDVAPGALFR